MTHRNALVVGEALVGREEPMDILSQASAVAALTTTNRSMIAALPDRAAVTQFRETAEDLSA